MAAESTACSWQHANNDFSFAQEAPIHVPRGWERVPQPSHLARHRGRKVWKRPETTRAKEDVEKSEPRIPDEQRDPLRDVSTNTPRPVKRLRVQDGLAMGGQSEGGGFANYFATLQDGAAGTPKRKYTRRDTGKPEEATQEVATTGKNNYAEAKEGIEDATRRDETLEEHSDEVTKNEIELDALQASESPVQESVRDLLQSKTGLEVGIEVEAECPVDDLSSLSEDKIIPDEPVDVASHETPHNTIPEGNHTSESKRNSAQHKKTVEATVTIPDVTADRIIDAELNAATGFAAESDIKTPNSQARKHGAIPTSKLKIESPQDSQSPQIGMTLLRRESLRTRASPRKKGSAQKSKTPQRRHGLKKRDTLQEREILQQFNAAASPNQAFTAEHLANPDRKAPPSNLSHDLPMIATENARSVETPCENFKEESTPDTDPGGQIGDVVLQKEILDSKDLARAVEAIQVCQSSNEKEMDAAFNNAPLSLEANQQIDEANHFIAKLEVEETAQTIAEVGQKIDLPTRKTRSGARISDDTSMLKEFLNRAQAKKAAKTLPPLSAEIPKLQGSPTRRSPRKALEPQNGYHGSPPKSRKGAKGPSTPPRKIVVEEVDSSDEHETVNEPAIFRRSTRTRLSAPSKTPPGAPSFIPVRRGDGSDQIVLQKSQAQEMAIVTRANTRRNKGQSKPPALALQDLPAESPVKMTAKERADHAKKVAWAEKLASYQESKDAPEEPEEQRPKVRRMRGLGPVNGTPAKKSTATVTSSNGTPAPKRRSKTR